MATILNDALEEYLSLVRAFPLVSIRSNQHLDEALMVIDRLLESPTLAAGEEAYLQALTDLVETYEGAHVPIPAKTGIEALHYLMRENSLTQADLVPLFGTPSIVSEVLAGKRPLALAHVKKLAAHFGLPADVFIDPV